MKTILFSFIFFQLLHCLYLVCVHSWMTWVKKDWAFLISVVIWTSRLHICLFLFLFFRKTPYKSKHLHSPAFSFSFSQTLLVYSQIHIVSFIVLCFVWLCAEGKWASRAVPALTHMGGLHAMLPVQERHNRALALPPSAHPSSPALLFPRLHPQMPANSTEPAQWHCTTVHRDAKWMRV